MVRSIPEDIRVTIDAMKIGDRILLKDLVLPEGAKLLSDPETLVAAVSVVAEEVVAVEAEVAAVTPEVIGEKKEEEGAAGAEDKKKE
jgi:large subunit ribosomal protein L25